MKDIAGLINIGQLQGFDTTMIIVEQVMTFIGETDFVVAGGFVRDAVLGRQYKDIDVFIPNYEADTEEGHDEEIQYELSDTLDLVTDDVRINIIRLGWRCQSIVEVLKRMDTGICQAALVPKTIPEGPFFTGHYDVLATPHFVDDVAYKQITVMRPDLRESGRSDHIDRLIAKFPDYELRDHFD